MALGIAMSGNIFISYRRSDSDHAAGRLALSLEKTFQRQQLFMDIDNIEPGINFVKALSEKVGACDVLLAIIGPSWLEATDENGQRRLDSARDFVRIEIEAALKRDVRVIPVLVDGAQMPKEEQLPEPLKELSQRQAVRLSHERFAADADGLASALQRIVQPPSKPTGRTFRPETAEKPKSRAPREAPSPRIAPNLGQPAWTNPIFLMIITAALYVAIYVTGLRDLGLPFYRPASSLVSALLLALALRLYGGISVQKSLLPAFVLFVAISLQTAAQNALFQNLPSDMTAANKGLVILPANIVFTIAYALTFLGVAAWTFPALGTRRYWLIATVSWTVPWLAIAMLMPILAQVASLQPADYLLALFANFVAKQTVIFGCLAYWLAHAAKPRAA
jgi:hypothetical protein